MQHRSIGTLRVSLVGIGCNNFGWRIDAAATQRVVDAALDCGINFFDTADMYGAGQSEQFLGQALRGRREQAVIATKFGLRMGDGMEGARPAYVRQALDASLQRLGVDHIDLYQLHRPDANTPIADTMEVLNEAVKAGKVREIGCSNFTVEQMQAARATHGPAYFASVQNEYSLLERGPEAGVLAECARTLTALLPYFPLASGLLSGKYRKGVALPEGSRGKDDFGPKVFTDGNLDRVEAWTRFAESHGHNLLELAMSWLAARPEVASIIAGAKSPEQVRANAAAVNWTMTADEVTQAASL
jgi:aryl-alcohol dehydrogenase-like predicted oxidoreductase